MKIEIGELKGRHETKRKMQQTLIEEEVPGWRSIASGGRY